MTFLKTSRFKIKSNQNHKLIDIFKITIWNYNINQININSYLPILVFFFFVIQLKANLIWHYCLGLHTFCVTVFKIYLHSPYLHSCPHLFKAMAVHQLSSVGFKLPMSPFTFSITCFNAHHHVHYGRWIKCSLCFWKEKKMVCVNEKVEHWKVWDKFFYWVKIKKLKYISKKKIHKYNS